MLTEVLYTWEIQQNTSWALLGTTYFIHTGLHQKYVIKSITTHSLTCGDEICPERDV